MNNNPNVQKIAISDISDAFSSPDVVKNILSRIFKRNLKKLGLNIEIEPLFEREAFWKIVSNYTYGLKYICFEFIKPNLANISSSLPEDFKSFSDNVNSHKSTISIQAPKNGHLENINKQNLEVDGLVNYTSEGAGSIKIRVRGISKTISTNENPVYVQAQEIAIEGSPTQVIKAFKSIVE